MKRQQIIKIGVILLLGLSTQCGIVLAAGVVEGDRMQVSLERSGGFANIPLSVNINTETLSSDQAAQLHEWIETAQFFDLPSSLVNPMQRDRFQYQITVEEGDRRHSIHVSESEMPENLKPLVRWLTTQATRG
ncbi:MAG TPA: protealysin inhibitor emfourin [Crinalium sp.]|jgi:hypothetical protein